MQHRGVWASIPSRDFHQDVARLALRVLDEDIEISVLSEYAGIEQFVFWLVAAAARIFANQSGIGKRALGVLVEHLQIGMRRRRVQVEVMLFDVLAVVSFGVRQAEQTLFQNGIAAVP